MAKSLYSRAIEQEILFIWGFPNHNSHYGRKSKLGWLDIYEIPVKQLDLRRYLPSSPVEKNLKYAQKVTVSSLKPGNQEKHKVFFKRSTDYYLWRYKNNPRYNYTARTFNNSKHNYILYKKYTASNLLYLDIVEFEAETANHFSHLILNLLLEGIEDNMAGINIWMNTHHEYSVLLEKMGFVNTLPITFFSFYGDNLSRDNKVFKILSDYRNWKVTMGDSDVY